MWGLRLWHDVGIALPEAKATSTSYWTAAKDKPRSGGERGYVSGHDQRGEGPDPRNQPLGRGVTVTDWRLYTADHRQHIDGGGKPAYQYVALRILATAARMLANTRAGRSPRLIRASARSICSSTTANNVVQHHVGDLVLLQEYVLDFDDRVGLRAHGFGPFRRPASHA